MPKIHKPRAGSLQFWPRKRAAKLLPSVNWRSLSKHKGFLGFIGYKAGMIRVLARDLTPDSLTKNKQIILPSTLIECPPMKILSIRFYRNGKVVQDIIVDNLDKELKHKIKLPKQKINFEERLAEAEKKISEFDDVRVIVYSKVKETGIKKSPDIAEIGIGGNSPLEKLAFVKSYLNKEIKPEDVFSHVKVVDIRGVTKGYGLKGPVKRFNLSLRQHKSEKGRRRPGTLGPWTPSRVTFRAPMAGQYGFFTRVTYNSKILKTGIAKELDNYNFEFPRYGKISTEYILLKGSIQGCPKRQLLLTLPLRETKRTVKKHFEILNLLK